VKTNYKNDFLTKIKENIKEYGHHVTIVSNGIAPRYAYTIGVKEALGIELIFAGGMFYMQDEVLEIVNEIVGQLKNSSNFDGFQIGSRGSFELSKVHHSWSSLMMLGYFDFYKVTTVAALQIIPGSTHFTLDVPDMSKEWNLDSEPIWKWLSKTWDNPVPENSTIVTNLAALRGAKITEVMRWEQDEWEAFVGPGPDVRKEDIRVVSVGTLLGIDASLEPILTLPVGNGLWRDSADLTWHEWK
jgi:hypothetical protein